MILEQAIRRVKPGQEEAFVDTRRQAQSLIAATPGFVRRELRACLETAARYLLLVWWQQLENHPEDFRGSDRYREWRRLLHDFYEPFPLVEHYAEPLIVTQT